MKKNFTALLLCSVFSISLNAQTRMTLHEEFSGENCAGCWGENPAFWTLCDSPSNVSKIIHITYMMPIPTGGWYDQRTLTTSNARNSYYSGVPFAPFGRYDGHIPDMSSPSPGEVKYFTQADINAEAAKPDSFNMTVTGVWNATYDSVITTVQINCITNWTGTYPRLRVALTQTNDFVNPPGNIPEIHFANVVQDMYPAESGTGLPVTWTAGMTQTYTFTAKFPSFLDKSVPAVFVAWMQNDDYTRNMIQAAKSAPLPILLKDLAIIHSLAPIPFNCATGTYSTTHTIWLRNTGQDTVTSADIYYKLDGGAYLPYAWSGSLVPGDSVSVAMPAVSVTVAAPKLHFIKDSVAMPGGIQDFNTINNVDYDSFFVQSSAGKLLPYATSFEGTDTNYYATDKQHVLYQFWKVPIWQIYNSAALAHSGSHAAGLMCQNAGINDDHTLVLPTLRLFAPSKTTLSFWEAYARTLPGYNDSLQIVYSTDCGANWNVIWRMGGTAMETAPSSYGAPASPSNYALRTVNLSGVPTGDVLIGFRVLKGNGNFVFIDDVNITSTVVAVTNVGAGAEHITIYPNPAENQTILTFDLISATTTRINIADVTGREIMVVKDEEMNAGNHSFAINTSAMGPGVYSVNIHTAGGAYSKRLVVIK